MKCPDCHKTFSRPDALKRHQTTQHGDESGRKNLACRHCDDKASRLDTLRKHVRRKHRSVNAGDGANAEHGLQNVPHSDGATQGPSNALGDANLDAEAEEIDVGVPADDNSFESLSLRVQHILEQNRGRIETYVRESNRLQDLYNFTVRSASASELKGFLHKIFESQKHRFKINVSFGFILKNHLTGELVYYYASTNNRLLEHPVTVGHRADLDGVFSSIEQHDILEYCQKQRPNSKYGVIMITNALFYVNKMKSFTIGCADAALQEYLLSKRSLINFIRDRHGMRYRDNFCLFRCLAFDANGGTYVGLDRDAKKLCQEFCSQERISINSFPGVRIDQIPKVEDMFKVNIEIFTLEEKRRDAVNMLSEDLEEDEEPMDDQNVTQGPRLPACRLESHRVLRSRMRYERTVFLNLFKRHFSLITKLGAYSNCWSCKKCEKLFAHRGNAIAHERNCSSQTRIIFTGGGYGSPKTVFDLLEEHGIDVPADDRFYQFRLSFDFECLFEAEDTVPAEGSKNHISTNLSRHLLVCVLMCPTSIRRVASYRMEIPSSLLPKCTNILWRSAKWRTTSSPTSIVT